MFRKFNIRSGNNTLQYCQWALRGPRGGPAAHSAMDTWWIVSSGDGDLRRKDTVRLCNGSYCNEINCLFVPETFINLARPSLGNIMEKYEVFGTRPEVCKSKSLNPFLALNCPASMMEIVTGSLYQFELRNLGYLHLGCNIVTETVLINRSSR